MSFLEFKCISQLSKEKKKEKKKKSLSHNIVDCIFTLRLIGEDILDPNSKKKTSKLALAHLLT
jgi:hypothetical protein